MVSDLEQCSKAELISLIVELRSEFAAFKKFHLEQMAEVRQELAAVKRELSETQAELAKLKRPKKNSRNSSLPPSSDFSAPKRNQSLRESGKKKRRTARS